MLMFSGDIRVEKSKIFKDIEEIDWLEEGEMIVLELERKREVFKYDLESLGI